MNNVRGAEHASQLVLHDFMYSRIESELYDYIYNVEADTDLYGYNFASNLLVKAHGFIEIHDFSRIYKYTKEFNDLGRAITYCSNVQKYSKMKGEALKRALEQDAGKVGLHHDQRNYEEIANMIERFCADDVRIVLTNAERTRAFAGNVDTSYLRVPLARLHALYYSPADVEFTIVGQVTSQPVRPGEDAGVDDRALGVGIIVDSVQAMPETESVQAELGDHLIRMSDSFLELQRTFLTEGERASVVLKPLAIYQEFKLDKEVAPTFDGG